MEKKRVGVSLHAEHVKIGAAGEEQTRHLLALVDHACVVPSQRVLAAEVEEHRAAGTGVHVHREDDGAASAGVGGDDAEGIAAGGGEVSRNDKMLFVEAERGGERRREN